jgi:long-chain-alcohol oxidase
MGSCRMGLDPRSSVVDSGNETHEVDNLFVADASCFPTASGVNPMLTAYAFAHRAASSVARRFT